MVVSAQGMVGVTEAASLGVSWDSGEPHGCHSGSCCSSGPGQVPVQLYVPLIHDLSSKETVPVSPQVEGVTTLYEERHHIRVLLFWRMAPY